MHIYLLICACIYAFLLGKIENSFSLFQGRVGHVGRKDGELWTDLELNLHQHWAKCHWKRHTPHQAVEENSPAGSRPFCRAPILSPGHFAHDNINNSNDIPSRASSHTPDLLSFPVPFNSWLPCGTKSAKVLTSCVPRAHRHGCFLLFVSSDKLNF